MFLSNLSILGRKVFWLIFAIMLSIAAISIHAIVRVKSQSAGGNTACSKVTTSTGNEFSGYLSISAAQMRSESSASSDDEVIIFTSNIFEHPSNYIAANGHAVTISAVKNDSTRVWVDENDNGKIDADETVTGLTSFMSTVYIYGGSDTQQIDVTSNTKTNGKISITMTGGSIGAIFAGGPRNVKANSIDINITGGSVHYVDCGGHTGGVMSSGSASVLLRDCKYRSNMPVNGLNRGRLYCADVTVYDYSEHFDSRSYTRFTPSFNNFVCPIEANSYVMGGNVTIPADMDVYAKVLVVKEDAVINNLGRVTTPSCDKIYMLDGSVWNGNSIITSHPNMTLDHYTFSHHYQNCSREECKVQEIRAHIWSYVDNGDGTHTKRCGVCGYSYSENHDQVQEYDNASSLKCKYCENVQTVSNAASARMAGSAATCSHDSHYYKYITSCHHVNHRAEGVVEYDINHGRVACCSGCDIILPFVSGSRLFASLTDVCNLMKTAGTTSVSVTMCCDAAPGETEVIDISGKTINLEMYGCDINRDVQVTAGTLKISNSKFGTDHYAHFTKNFTASSSATIEADGCYFNSLSAGASTNATIKLGNIRCGNLTLNGKNKLTLTDKVVVEKRLFKGWISGAYLPSGYVIGEMLADGSWLSLYDHTATNIPYYLGPLEKTGNATTSPVAIMPCIEHQLSSVSSYDSDGHTGACRLCGATVKVAHNMTSGMAYSTQTGTHKTKCSECDYTFGSSAHEFSTFDGNAGERDGYCKLCGAHAGVMVHGQYSPKAYFATFDEAFDVVNYPAMYDTITLLMDNTIKIYTKLASLDGSGAYRGIINPAYSFVDNGQTYEYGPFIHVIGNGYTLYLGEGAAIMRPAEPYYYPSFKAGYGSKYTFDQNKSKLYLSASEGCMEIKNAETNITTVDSCSHTTPGPKREPIPSFDYYIVNDATGNVMPYHKKVCGRTVTNGGYPSCGYTEMESHNFTSSTTCSKCGATSTEVSVARVTGPAYSTPKGFATLKAAWEDALTKSKSSGKTYTIQVLADVNMSEESSSSWEMKTTSSYSNVDIVLDATDDNGVEHTITAYNNSSLVVRAEYGKLTIKSGVYKAYTQAVYTSGNKKLILEGGTYICTNSSYKKNAIQNEEYGLNGYTLPYGYILVDESDKNNVKVVYNSFNTSETSYGTVKKCGHTNMTLLPAEAASCFSMGSISYGCCNICRYYVLSETGECLKSAPALLPTLGHNFVNQVCTRCGAYACGLRVTKYAADGTLIQSSLWPDFSRAWAVIKQWDSSASEGQKYVIKLEADVTLSADEDVSTLVEDGGTYDVTIDLNGHNLNLDALYQVNKYLLNCTYRNLTVTNSSSNKSVLSGPIIQNSEGNAITLNNVEYRTMKLKCANLVLTNNAGFVLLGRDDNTSNVLIKNLSVENGCYLDGEACYLFKLYGTEDNGTYEMDLDESLVDLAHHLTVEQQDCNGDWFTVPGTSKFVLTSGTVGQLNPISVNTSKGTPTKSCYRWHAVKQDVEHTLNGRRCSVCGLNTHHYLLHDKTTYTDSYHQYIGAVYERPIAGSDVWESLYAPMSFNTEDYAGIVEFGDIYSFGRMFDTNGNGRIDSGDETWLIVDLMTSGKTEANYPYLIRGKSAMNVELSADQGVLYSSSNSVNSCSTAQATYTFCGTNLGAALNSPAGILMLDSKGELSSISDNTVAPQRWYVQTTGNSNSAELRQAYSNGIRVMVIGEDISQETAIKLLKGETVEVDLDGQHYTLDGRKATKTQSGLQIVNGKKIITK